MRKTLAAIIVVVVSSACAPAADPSMTTDTPSVVIDSELEARVDGWAQEAIDEGRVAGLSVAVRHQGRELLSKGYGHADLENDVAAGPHTVYRIGSITKQFTAAAIMQLVEQGRLDLDDAIGEHVDFDTQGRTVTIRHLLDHTSGIKSYTGLGPTWRRTVPLAVTHDELLGLVVDHPFDFEPGERWAYNNTGYYLLGVVVESITDSSYQAYLDQHVFAPARLEHTTYCDEKRLIPNRAEGYEVEEGALVNDDPISMTQPFAAGALCSDVVDLLAWQDALSGGDVVSEASYAMMTTPGTLADGSAHTYGFGLNIGEREGHARVAHGGGINGFVTFLSDYPDDELQIVVLTNTPGPTAGRVEERIARHLLGLPPPEDSDGEDDE